MSSSTSMLRPIAPESEADLAALADLLRSVLSEADAVDYVQRLRAALSQRPRWVPGSQELWWRGQVVKYIRHDAENQTTVLAAFQKAGWPPSIADPLPAVAGRNSKSCRRNTVKSLNKGQTPGTIRFHSEGRGGVRWEEDV